MDASQFAGMSDDEVLAFLNSQGEIPWSANETGVVLRDARGFQFREKADGTYEVTHPLLRGRMIWKGATSDSDYYE